MNNKAVMAIVRMALCLLYVWIVREAYLFVYADSCLDAGGALGGNGRCSDPTLDDAPDLVARAPFVFWLVLLALPAVAVWLLDRAIGSGIRRQSSNKTIEPMR